MSRFSLTPLMRPTSLQPSLTGPRDAVRVHSITTPEERAEDNPPAPAPTQTTKGKPMNAAPNQDAILAALKKKSPADLDYLERTTGIARPLLFATLPLMKKKQTVEASPHQRGVYGLPGTDFPSVAPRPTGFPSVKAGAQPKAKTKPAKAGKAKPAQPLHHLSRPA